TPDIAGVEPAGTPKEPRLRVQSRPGLVVSHLDLGAVLPNEHIERSSFRCAHVRSGDHSQRDAPLLPCSKSCIEHADASEPYEGAQQIYMVSAGEFAGDLTCQSRLAVGVRQECDIREWCLRMRWRGLTVAHQRNKLH